ncbi:tyrosine-type recombinase/integrase [Shimia aestuarii]|uniref:tyrosine-type recombinase/integrase n=1 Tax=Shimia aestuarii TaxID=254406 RepID=UPI001FB2F759|nr:site-specific integrase [Shimia aestuarii]
MRAFNKLPSNAAASLPAGKHEDGGGLRLVKKADGGGQWVYRYSLHGRRREMGLGPIPAVSLKAAREEAAKWRARVAMGYDPIAERDKERANRLGGLFKEVALDAFEARKAELKDDGKAGRWLSPLEQHVFPKLGKVPIAQITQRDIRDCLAPIWHTKAATAKKAINRLNVVFKHAAALELDVDIQAVGKARELLGKQRHKETHIPAMPWQDVPEFYHSLEEPSVATLALRLLILTGARSGPIRMLKLDDIEGDVWTIPAEDMKGRVGAVEDFRVPLSSEAQNVIEAALPFARNGFLFWNRKNVISDMAMAAIMKRRGLEARPHGFRTSLREWLAECTTAQHEVAEMVLAHKTDSSVVRSYRRTDFLDQRRPLMERWAQHCCGQDGQVVRMVSQ